MIATVPVFQRLGSEFMPPLDEGSLLVMPTTFAGISIEARRAMQGQHQTIMKFPEGRLGPRKGGSRRDGHRPRAARHDRIRHHVAASRRMAHAAHASVVAVFAPAWLKRPLGAVWPEERARTLAELSRDLDAQLRTPGYQLAIAPPIRTRIDMLTTGVRTPVGKVFGEDLNEIERVSIALEGMLRQVPGTRSTFAERQTGRECVDIVPNREAIARYGLTVRDVQDVIEAAVGGMQVSTAIAGRARFSINLGTRPIAGLTRRRSAHSRAGAIERQRGGLRRRRHGRGRQRPEWRHGGSTGSPAGGGMGSMGGGGSRGGMAPSGAAAGTQGALQWLVRRRLTCLSSGGSRARPFRSESWPTSGWSRARR